MNEKFERNLKIIEYLEELESWAERMGFYTDIDYTISDEGLDFHITIESDPKPAGPRHFPSDRI